MPGPQPLTPAPLRLGFLRLRSGQALPAGEGATDRAVCLLNHAKKEGFSRLSPTLEPGKIGQTIGRLRRPLLQLTGRATRDTLCVARGCQGGAACGLPSGRPGFAAVTRSAWRGCAGRTIGVVCLQRRGGRTTPQTAAELSGLTGRSLPRSRHGRSTRRLPLVRTGAVRGATGLGSLDLACPVWSTRRGRDPAEGQNLWPGDGCWTPSLRRPSHAVSTYSLVKAWG